MTIFPEETSLETIINERTSASLVSSIALSEPRPELLIHNLENLKNQKFDKRICAAIEKLSDKHPDFLYGSAILVSTVMNLNDDVFLPKETWAARFTPINTPYNNQHEEEDIIGHIISSQALSKDGQPLDMSGEATDYFDIEVDFVLYKEIFPVIAQQIIDEAPLGKRFVSMECTFNSFDYALVDKDNNTKIIERNRSTAFLTKYLRAYNGIGMYDNYKLGRVLRDFRFTGMGNVGEPGNPDSKYTKLQNVEVAKSILKKTVAFISKGKIMTKIETLEQAIAEIEKLQTEVTNLNVKAELVPTLENDKKTLAESLSTEQTKVQVTTQALEGVKAELATLKAELATVKTELQTKSDELSKRDGEKKALERVEALKVAGMEVSDEQKKTIAEWTEAQFTQMVAFAKQVLEKKPDTTNTKVLDNVQTDITKDITDTAGDNSTAALERMNTAAAKLVDCIRKSNKNKKK